MRNWKKYEGIEETIVSTSDKKEKKPQELKEKERGSHKKRKKGRKNH